MATVTETERTTSTAHDPVRVVRVAGGRTVAHWLAVAVGVTALVLGAVALARAGLADATLTSPEVTVGWLHHTPLLAIVHVVLGASLLSAGVARWGGESSIAATAGVLGVTGLVLLVESDAFHGALATHTAHALTYLAAAGALLGAALLPTRR